VQGVSSVTSIEIKSERHYAYFKIIRRGLASSLFDGYRIAMPVNCLQVYVDRFWSKVEKTDGCWIWRGGRKGHPTHRYGAFIVGKQRRIGPRSANRFEGGKSYAVHRLSWEWANGRDVPKGMLVCHTCDNPICVRPDHLFLGTHLENNRDRSAKGRNGGGDKRSVLTENDVRDIRALLSKGENRNWLAKLYGVTWATIEKIRARKIWKDVA
jgi:hypothetical protein